MTGIKKVPVRELQHHLSDYLEIAKVQPLLITRYGREEIILINSDQYNISKIKVKKKNVGNLMTSQFIGMHSNKKQWRSKTSVEIANELRREAWYGR